MTSRRIAFEPAALFLVLAVARPERRVVWAIIALALFIIALRKSRAAPTTEA